MRIKSLQLAWFRGAARNADLLPIKCKSLVVYGCNGSGKSSFVDAVEYVLNGRIEHLAHEYSGKRQERGIVNTHTPEDQKTEVLIKFDDTSNIQIHIEKNGARHETRNADVSSWKYRRSVLRQHEVSDFITSTKTDKYSALLPLLGLAHLEHGAENLRSLAKSVATESRLDDQRSKQRIHICNRKQVFGEDDDCHIFGQIKKLCLRYDVDTSKEPKFRSWCELLGRAIAKRVEDSSAEQRLFVAISDLAALDIKERVASVRTANGQLSDTVEPLIVEKLEILQSAESFIMPPEGEDEINCPACGRLIKVAEFDGHIKSEQKRLEALRLKYGKRKSAIGSLCDDLNTLKRMLRKVDLKLWYDSLEEGDFTESYDCLVGLNVEGLRASCSEEDLKSIENNFLPFIDAATAASENAPPDAQQLSTDKGICEAAIASDDSRKLELSIEQIELLVEYITAMEKKVRKQIKIQAKKILNGISEDMKSMWGILHPSEPITDVKLALPSGDKAIDVSLKYYDIDQDSPRLTLSEGHRNSLGLCIFMAMAKQETTDNWPMILDDVVISLDRGHRGMIA